MRSVSPAQASVPVRVMHISEIVENPAISSSARVLYAILRNMMGRDGTVEIYSRDIAKKIGCGEKTVSNLNAELRAYGAIETRGQGTGKPLRYVMLGIAGLAAAAGAHFAGGHGTAEGLSLGLFISGDKPESQSDTTQSQNNAQGSQNFTTPTLSDSPTREYLNKHQHAAHARPIELTDAEVLLLRKLIDHGVTVYVGEQLVREFPDRCRQQLEFLPYRAKIKNTPAYLVAAIRNDDAMPQKLRELQKRETWSAAQPAPIDTSAAIAERERSVMAELLEALPETERYRLKLQADEHASSGIWGRMTGDNGPFRKKIRDAKFIELAREFIASAAVSA